MKADEYFAVVPESVLDGVGSKAVHLYAILRRYTDKGGEAFPRRRTLATRMGCSPDTVDRATRQLIAAGFLTVEARYRDDGGRTSNLYTLRSTPIRTRAEGGSRVDAEGHAAPVRHEEREPVNESQIELAACGETVQSGDGSCPVPVPCWYHDPFDPAVLDGRDLVWEALTLACGVPATRSERGRWNRAAKDLRDAGFTGPDVLRLAVAYRRRWPTIDMTPTGLAANVTVLRSSRPGSVSAALEALGAGNGA